MSVLLMTYEPLYGWGTKNIRETINYCHRKYMRFFLLLLPKHNYLLPFSS